MEMTLKDLSKPFKEADIEWRIQSSGEKNGKPWARVLAYITNRAIMDRLDEVCGPENWKNEYKDAPGGGILCGLSIRSGVVEWVTKWDGAEQTDIEAVKGGLSGAMKRAGVHWGIGRYLYDLEAGFANIHGKGRYSDKDKKGNYFKWDPPKLPSWALPDGASASKPETPEPEPEGRASETTTKDYQYLTAMRKQKTRVGDEKYYETLLFAGKKEYTKSNLITDKEEQKAVYRALLALPDKEKV